MANPLELSTRLLLCAKTKSQWDGVSSTVLMKGEIGLETDTYKFKVGDGTSAWSALPYWHGTDRDTNTTYSITKANGKTGFTVTPSSGDPYTIEFGAAADKGVATSVAQNNNNLVTSGAVYTYVSGLMGSLDALDFQGTTTAVPTGTIKKGYTYKVAKAFTLTATQTQSGQAESVKIGDLLIAMDNSKWVVVPSGDEVITSLKTTGTFANVTINSTAKNGEVVLGNAAGKVVDSSVSNSANALPTSAAVQTYVGNTVNNAIENLPTMVGATSSANGTRGYVPAPATGNRSQFLRGDGTWATPTNTTYKVATASTAGLVKSSTSENTVAVGTDGVMTVNDINISKLVQGSTVLILNGNFLD